MTIEVECCGSCPFFEEPSELSGHPLCTLPVHLGEESGIAIWRGDHVYAAPPPDWCGLRRDEQVVRIKPGTP